MEAVYAFDYSVLNFIQEHFGCAFCDGFFGLVTHLGDGGIFCIALAALLLCFKKTRKMGFVMGMALAFGAIVGNLILKPAVARVRPYENPQYAELIRLSINDLLIKAPTDFSFPSGHTLASYEASVGILMCSRKWGIPAVIIGTLVAFSRLYLYVHYCTDVLAGLVLGSGFAVASYFIVGAVEKKIKSKKQADAR